MTSAYNNGSILGMIGEDYMLAAGNTAAGAFAQMMGSQIDYGSLYSQAANYSVQASNIELQAQQRANQLREQFIGAIGSYQFGAAQRGVSVGSGSVTSNIENSSIALGKDITTMQQNAGLQASALRAQANNLRKSAKAQRSIGLLNGLSGVLDSISILGIGYDKAQQGAVKTEYAKPEYAKSSVAARRAAQPKGSFWNP